MKKIRVDGFSDIVDIIWEEDVQMMSVRSNAEERCKDMSKQSEILVILWIENVEKDKDKQCFIEHMMLGKYRLTF